MQLPVSVPNSVVELQWYLTSTRFDQWMRNELFQFRWWLLIGVFIVSAYAWWKMVDKTRLNEIVLYTALIAIITLMLDELGEELCLWDYPMDLIPLFPPLTAINLASLPMIYSLIYQHFDTWKQFIIAIIVMATIFTFVLEPFFVWAGIYQTLTWKYYYGLPIYIAIGICTRAAMIKLDQIVDNNKK
jgi:hypothetical protein